MAGHNKWSKIKHKKASEDNKKSKEFSRCAQLITTAVREAGGDAESPAVRTAVEQAKAINMPSLNIERAIKKGTGELGGAQEEVLYEAYGPGGVALIISGYTDNKNRSGAEVRSTLTKQGFSLAEQGAATWAFEKEGGVWQAKTTIPLSDDDKEKLNTLVETLLLNDSVDEVYTNEE